MAYDNSTKLNIDDVLSFKADHKVCYASHYGNGKDKKLYITLGGSYQVYNHGEMIHEGMQPFPAIDKYNNL